MSSAWRRSAAAALALVLTAGLLEAGAAALVHAGTLVTPRPHHGDTGFWWHQHPEFGAWHHPDSEGFHNGPCYKVTYSINSAGARDREREKQADGPRVVVLGDSFLEGYGIEARSRLSNLLEESTGVPHLNFAMASFGTYQEFLVYRDLASQFDHSAVLLSVLPVNDFADIDFELGSRFTAFEYAYRPYLVGEPPDLRRYDHREGWLVRQLRLHSYAWNAVSAAWTARRAETEVGSRSFFYDFEPHQVALLEAILERLVAAAEGRPVAVALIPAAEDLERYAEAGPDPLGPTLVPIAARLGIQLVNLLPAMAEHSRTWSAFFLSCDFHWSPYGNRVARDLLLERLDASFFAAQPPRTDAR